MKPFDQAEEVAMSLKKNGWTGQEIKRMLKVKRSLQRTWEEVITYNRMKSFDLQRASEQIKLQNSSARDFDIFYIMNCLQTPAGRISLMSLCRFDSWADCLREDYNVRVDPESFKLLKDLILRKI